MNVTPYSSSTYKRSRSTAQTGGTPFSKTSRSSGAGDFEPYNNQPSPSPTSTITAEVNSNTRNSNSLNFASSTTAACPSRKLRNQGHAGVPITPSATAKNARIASGA